MQRRPAPGSRQREPGSRIDAFFLDGAPRNAQVRTRYGEEFVMSILAEKSFGDKAGMNQHAILFHRHPANPILTATDWPCSMNILCNSCVTWLAAASQVL